MLDRSLVGLLGGSRGVREATSRIDAPSRLAGAAADGVDGASSASRKVWSSAAGDVVVDSSSLPGRRGLQIGRRLNDGEMEGLQLAFNREFALIYEVGAGRNGGGGQYLLFSGEKAKVWFPARGDYRWISHSHPAGFAQHASAADQNWLRLMQKNGNPQQTSRVVPLDGPAFQFNVNSNRLP